VIVTRALDERVVDAAGFTSPANSAELAKRMRRHCARLVKLAPGVRPTAQIGKLAMCLFFSRGRFKT